jgi:hypothetical protein
MNIEKQPSGKTILTNLDHHDTVAHIEIDPPGPTAVAQIYFRPGVTNIRENTVYLNRRDIEKLRAPLSEDDTLRLSDYPDIKSAEQSVFDPNGRFFRIDPARFTAGGLGFQLTGLELEVIEKALQPKVESVIEIEKPLDRDVDTIVVTTNYKGLVSLFFRRGETTFGLNKLVISRSEIAALLGRADGKLECCLDGDVKGLRFHCGRIFVEVDRERLKDWPKWRAAVFIIHAEELETIKKVLDIVVEAPEFAEPIECDGPELPVKLSDLHVTKVERSTCYDDAVLITSSKESDCLRLRAAELLELHKAVTGRDVLAEIFAASKAMAYAEGKVVNQNAEIASLNARIRELEGNATRAKQEGYSEGRRDAVKQLTRKQRSEIARFYVAEVRDTARKRIRSLEDRVHSSHSEEQARLTAGRAVVSSCNFLLSLPAVDE